MGPPQQIRLPGGRLLAYREFGASDGSPCLHLPGWPSSGLLGMVYDEAARTAGVRWISLDRPGFGASDRDPCGGLLSFASDAAALADQLGLARFAAVGESGGSPFALAMAHELAARLTVAITLGGWGPLRDKRDRAQLQPFWRRSIALALHAPWLLRAQLALYARAVRDPRKAQRMQRALVENSPEPDRRALAQFDTSTMMPATAEALRDGGRTAAQELRTIALPWGFALSEITVPVQVWHGTEDRSIPISAARRLIGEIPGCRARLLDGEGHTIGPVHRDEVMATVAQHE